MSESLPSSVSRQRDHQVSSGISSPRESRIAGEQPPPTMEAMHPSTSTPRKRPRLSRTLVGLALVLLIAIFVLRWLAPSFDHAVVNIFTLILGFFSWMLLTLGLKASSQPRLVWRTLLAAPFVGVAAMACVFRWDGVDSELVPQLTVRWKTYEPLPEIGETRSIGTERLNVRNTDFTQFFGSQRNGEITGVELETDWAKRPPQLLWKHAIGAGWSGFAIRGDTAITLEQRDSDQWISAYDVESGELLWKHAVPGRHDNALGGLGPRATPTIHGDRVLAHMATGQFLCLDLASGKVLWEKDLLALVDVTCAESEVEVSWGRSGSPLVVDNLVLIPLGGAGKKVVSMIAMDLESGKEMWRSGNDQISYSSPILAELDGFAQILCVHQDFLVSCNVRDGKELWRFPWQGKSSSNANVSQPIVLDANRVFLSKGYGQGCAMISVGRDGESWTTKKVWENTTALKTKFTNCVVKDNFAYGLSDGILECVNLDDGKSVWKRGRYRHGQLLLVGQLLLISSEAGEVVLVAANPKKFEELAKFDAISEVTWNPPALSGDRLLIRNGEEAACLRLPLVLGSTPEAEPETAKSL